MGSHAGQTLSARSKPLLAIGSVVVLAVMHLAGVSVKLGAQSTGVEAPNAQPPVPQWQIDAGGKMEFDVASVKQDAVEPSASTRNSNIPLGPQDLFAPTGGLLSATNWPLFQYAYKLTPNQLKDLRSQLPKWASTERFDIQARGSGNPTKDQFRLMMQALLADRFKLAIHFETRQLPVLALALDKPGKLGPQIQPHPSNAPCSTAPPPLSTGFGPPPTVAGGFPESCGALDGWPSQNPPGRLRLGARNVTMAMLATSFDNPATGIDRPVLDKTGLDGKYDFIMEFTPQITGPLPPGANFTPDESGPTFMEALKEQLGLKLESQTGPVDVIVVDHVEQPSEN